VGVALDDRQAGELMGARSRIRELEETLRGIGGHARSGVDRLEEGDAVAQQMFRHIAEQCDEVLGSARPEETAQR
jgi:hypothetical protein